MNADSQEVSESTLTESEWNHFNLLVFRWYGTPSCLILFDWGFRPTGGFFTHSETSSKPVKGCKCWPVLGTNGHWVLSSEGSLACHTYCDTEHPFIIVVYNLHGTVTLTLIAESLAVEPSLHYINYHNIITEIVLKFYGFYVIFHWPVGNMRFSFKEMGSLKLSAVVSYLRETVGNVGFQCGFPCMFPLKENPLFTYCYSDQRCTRSNMIWILRCHNNDNHQPT